MVGRNQGLFINMANALNPYHYSKKWRLVKETKHFIIQDGIMYQMGQDRKFQRCVTRDQA
jgi:hypothetical protein